MGEYQFTLVISGDVDHDDALFEAGYWGRRVACLP